MRPRLSDIVGGRWLGGPAGTEVVGRPPVSASIPRTWPPQRPDECPPDRLVVEPSADTAAAHGLDVAEEPIDRVERRTRTGDGHRQLPTSTPMPSQPRCW
jgi:hypothetical protein